MRALRWLKEVRLLLLFFHFNLDFRRTFRLLFFLDGRFARCQHYQHRTAFHHRCLLNRADVCKRLGDLFQVFQRDLGIIHFATAEPDGHANLMPLQKPAAGVFHFEAAMGLIGLWAKADFLDLDLGLRFLGFFFLLGPLVNELAKIHDTADRRRGAGRNLHKIQFGIVCNLQRLFDGNDADIAAIRSDQADFRYTDAFIYSKFVSADKPLLVAYEISEVFPTFPNRATSTKISEILSCP